MTHFKVEALKKQHEAAYQAELQALLESRKDKEMIEKQIEIEGSLKRTPGSF